MLLVSDGFTDVLGLKEMVDLVKSHIEDRERLVKLLVRYAAGVCKSQDNVTVVLVELS